MKYRIYTKTEKAWYGMLSTIRKARSSIFLEMYTFLDDTTETHDFIDALEERARAGVLTKVIIDFSGSSGFSKESLERLRASGAEIIFFKALFRRTHNKILIVDARVAFVGGMNITKLYKKWNDLQIKMEGKIVKYILRSFAQTYESSGGKDEEVLKYDKELRTLKGKFWFLEHSPLKSSFRLRRYYKKRIDLAREKIVIVTPYFMPNRWLVRALKKARKRGVEVEMILPRVATHPEIANIANYFYIHKFSKYGVKAFLTKEMLHSKMMLVDAREGVLGSQNFDIISFDLNVESGVFFADQRIIKELEAVINKWKENSEEYYPGMRKTSLFDHFLEFCFLSFEVIIKFFNKLTA